MVTFGILFLSLIACQNIKPDAPEDTMQKDDNAMLLLSGLATETQLSFTDDDEKISQKTLENNFTNQPVTWRGINGTLEFTAIRTFEKEKGTFCREYQAKLITTVKEIAVKSIACRQETGVWIRQ